MTGCFVWVSVEMSEGRDTWECVRARVCFVGGGVCPAKLCCGQVLHENLIIDMRGEDSQLSLLLL